MQRLLAFVAFLTLTTVLSAQPQPQNRQGQRVPQAAQSQAATQAEPPKTAHLEGLVQSTTGEPIPRATIRLQGTPDPAAAVAAATGGVRPSTFTVTTGDDGAFTLENIPPGRNYRLSAQRPGYVNAQYGSRGPNTAGTPLTLTAGQVLKDLVIEMTPQGVVTGTVTDQNGDPVQNALVQLLSAQVSRGVRRYARSGISSTNDQGEYRIAGLVPGRYYLNVEDRSASLRNVDNQDKPESNLPTYYANTTDFRSAAPLDVMPGSELRGIDVRMLRGKVYTIRGRLVDASGNAPSGPVLLNIRAKPDPGGPAVNLASLATRAKLPLRPPNFTFEFTRLTPGPYIIQASGTGVVNGQPTAPMIVYQEVTLGDADVNDLVVHGTAGATLTGSVRVDGAELSSILPASSSAALTAATGNVVLTGLTPGRPSVVLMAVDPDLSSGARPGQVQDDGSFKIESIYPSIYHVSFIGLPQGVYVKSITYGGQDVTHAMLDLTNGAGGPLAVVLSPKAADLTGVVHNEDGGAVASVPVTLIPKTEPVDDPTGGLRTATTDQNGGFQFHSIPPGEYYLAAWEDPQAVNTLGPEGLRKLVGSATTVKLGESDHQAMEAKLVPEEKIAAEIANLP